MQFIDDTGTLRAMNDMAVGENARNNCYAASYAVADEQVIGLVFGEAEHWGALKMIDGELMVVDYTARQFKGPFPDESIPFPMVMPQDAWIATIEGWVGALYSQSLDNILFENVAE